MLSIDQSNEFLKQILEDILNNKVFQIKRKFETPGNKSVTLARSILDRGDDEDVVKFASCFKNILELLQIRTNTTHGCESLCTRLHRSCSSDELKSLFLKLIDEIILPACFC